MSKCGAILQYLTACACFATLSAQGVAAKLRLLLLRFFLLRLFLLRLACFGLLRYLLALEMAGNQEAERGHAAIQVGLRPVVMGGRKKSPWVPTLVEHNGVPVKVNGAHFIALSGNDYNLAAFLFGTANAPGKGGRNLSKVQIVRALWKARIQAQNEALAKLHQEEQGTEVLAAIWDNAVYQGGDADADVVEPTRRGSKKKTKVATKQQLAKLPPTINVTVPSAQDNVATVSFVLLCAEDKCLPSIELKTEVMETLWKECDAQFRSAADDGDGRARAPSTPPRAKRKRRTSPLVASPSSTSPGSGSNRKVRPPSTHHCKRYGRIQARWSDADGVSRVKSIRLENPSNAAEVEMVQKKALSLAKTLHGEPLS